MSSDATFSRQAAELIEHRIDELRRLPFDVVGSLPGATGENKLVAGRECTLTVYKQALEDNHLLVTVQLARPAMLGLLLFHQERGLVFSPHRPVREATPEELMRTGG